MKRIISNTFLALTGAAMLVAGAGWSRPAAASDPFIAQITTESTLRGLWREEAW